MNAVDFIKAQLDARIGGIKVDIEGEATHYFKTKKEAIENLNVFYDPGNVIYLNSYSAGEYVYLIAYFESMTVTVIRRCD